MTVLGGSRAVARDASVRVAGIQSEGTRPASVTGVALNILLADTPALFAWSVSAARIATTEIKVNFMILISQKACICHAPQVTIIAIDLNRRNA